jgi:hypothetical protein
MYPEMIRLGITWGGTDRENSRSGIQHHSTKPGQLHEAKMACFSFIEGWYNPLRLPLSSPNYGAPASAISNHQRWGARCRAPLNLFRAAWREMRCRPFGAVNGAGAKA